MSKILTADKVKRLPVGTNIKLVNEKSGEAGTLWIIKSGRKKLLKGIMTTLQIADKEGWHYETIDNPD